MKEFFAFSVPGLNGPPESVSDLVGGKIPTGGLTTTGGNALQVGLTIAIVFAIILALFTLVFSGIQWVQSGGDKQKVEAARHRITYTIIGLLVIFFAWFILNTLSQLFGFSLLPDLRCPPGNHLDYVATGVFQCVPNGSAITP